MTVQKIVSAQLALPLGTNLATGLIPFDLNHDGTTDLLIAPSLVNTGSDLPLYGIIFSGSSASILPNPTGTVDTTGHVKDWFLADLNGDGVVDLLLVDHGLELPASAGGYEDGSDQVLISTPTVLSAKNIVGAPKAFYHSAALLDLDGDGDLDAVIQQFGSPSLSVALNDGTGKLTLTGAGDPFPGTGQQSAPGALGVLHDGASTYVLAASYVAPVGGSPGTIRGYTYTTGALQEAFRVAFPAAFTALNLGAYEIVTGDFRHTGSDDAIIVAESVSLSPHTTYWMYLGKSGSSYVDMTTQMLGGYNPGVELPSKLLPFDVNGDGSLDLVGFSYDPFAASQNRLIWMNNGQGGFIAADTGSLGLGSGIVVPRFSTTASGSYSQLSGFYDLQPISASATEVDTYGVSGSIGLTSAGGMTASEAQEFEAVLRANPTSGSLPGALAGVISAVAAYASAELQTANLAPAISYLATTGADSTTSVATLSYQFFTGHTPSLAGLDYLIAPEGSNPNNINSSYYQNFSEENRYINFAVNLGKLGEGTSSFTAAYGGLSLSDATKAAYTAIFGTIPTDAKVAAILTAPTDLPGIATRADYFAYYGQDGQNGVGTKAAMVGYLLVEAVKADVGTFQTANIAFLTDLAQGHVTGSVDLVGTYHGIAYTGG